MTLAAARRILLEAEGHTGAVRFLTGLHVRLEDGKRTSVVTITRTGEFSDPRYGRFAITRSMLLSMVENFDKKTFGQDVFIDVSHQPQHGAAGRVLSLFVDGERLRARVEWTPLGVEAIRDRGFAYLSAEYHEDWRDNEGGGPHGPVLLGAALTVRPVIKRLDPILLSDDFGQGHAVLLHPTLQKDLTEEISAMKDKFLKLLAAALGAIKGLPDALHKQLTEGFTAAIEGVTEETQAQALLDSFTAAGEQVAKQLAGAGGAQGTITLDFSGLRDAMAAGGGMKAEDVVKLLEAREAERDKAAKKLAEDRQRNVDLFTRLLGEAEGIKALSEEARTRLGEAVELVTADMTEEQVRRLAEHQIKIGNDLAVQAQLIARGWQSAPGGRVHITMDDANKVKELQEMMDRNLGLLDISEARRYQATGGSLPAENKALAEKVLAMYDSQHGARLDAEHRMLAGGAGVVSDTEVPAVWERTVIREALHQLIGLQFVDSSTEQFATSYFVPFSYRDTTAAGRHDTRRYERQAIERAGVIQDAETAYNIPQKLAFLVSDEIRYLTRERHVNWDAVAENQRNATRIIGEDLEHLIFNEVLHAGDEFGAVAVTNENLEPQADGTKRVFLLANWPVVRPRKVFDLQGNQVGNTSNPVTVTYNSNPVLEYDGTGTQSAGTYYVLDYDLGEVYLVNQAGAIQTPADGTAYTISYSYATNAAKFDTDLGSSTLEDHWDKFFYAYGLRKAEIEDNRYHMANYGLMSGTVMNQVEQAKRFAANFRRPGTTLDDGGNLGWVKSVPNFKTTAPGLWMGDRRVVIGERGITRFRMTKPWTMGELENHRNADGKFTGEKTAYGDQFIVLHTPTPLKRAVTSIVLYSATARVARANP